MALPSAWRMARLGEECVINPRRPVDLPRSDAALTSFVPMAAVSALDGSITNPELRPFSEVRKGYTYFEESDVLFAKITPCMQNGKHAVAHGLTDRIGFGSTEFHVIRPGPNVLAEWLHFFLRQRCILEAATAHLTGAVGQQRLPDRFLASLQLPLPPLPEQRRIAALLTDQLAAVERARAATEVQLNAARALLRAYMNEPFARGGERWPARALGEMLRTPLRTGISKPASVTSRNVCLTLSAVRDGELRLDESKPVDVDDAVARRNLVKPGVFYVVRGNGNRGLVGRGAFAPDVMTRPVMYPDLLIEVDVDSRIMLPRFLRWLWDSDLLRTQIEDRASTSAGIYKINLRNLASVQIPVPSLEEQQRIANTLDALGTTVWGIQRTISEQWAGFLELPPTFLRQAFSGTS